MPAQVITLPRLVDDSIIHDIEEVRVQSSLTYGGHFWIGMRKPGYYSFEWGLVTREQALRFAKDIHDVVVESR